MAREMYLVGVSEEELKPSAKIEPPRTPKGWLENFWYHHKWLFLGCVFGAVALTVIIWQAATVNRPDYQVLLVTENAYLDVQLDPLEEALEPYGVDLDGDGEVEVQVLNCFMGSKGSQEYLANNQALQAHMISGDVMLYIFEPKQYENFTANIANVAQGEYSFFATLPFTEQVAEDGTVFCWKDSPRRTENKALEGLPQDLYFGVRSASGVVQNGGVTQQQAMDLLAGFATGEKTEMK